MKYPQNIDSDFFKRLIVAGWYEEREVLLKELPGILKDFPEVVNKFLKEIWYITFTKEFMYYHNDDIIFRPIEYIFGETCWSFDDYSYGSYSFDYYSKLIGGRISQFGFKERRSILIDELGRVYIVADSGDLYYVDAKFYEGLYNVIYNRGESYIALGDGIFMCERTQEKYHINDIS